jgi:hypothetical protein
VVHENWNVGINPAASKHHPKTESVVAFDAPHDCNGT